MSPVVIVIVVKKEFKMTRDSIRRTVIKRRLRKYVERGVVRPEEDKLKARQEFERKLALPKRGFHPLGRGN